LDDKGFQNKQTILMKIIGYDGILFKDDDFIYLQLLECWSIFFE